MSYYMYGGQTPAAGRRHFPRLTGDEDREVERMQRKHHKLAAASVSSINRNILNFVNGFERSSKKKPEDYDDGILELEAAINRMYELRYEAQQVEEKRKKVQDSLRRKANLANDNKKKDIQFATRDYLNSVRETVPFAPKGLRDHTPFTGWPSYDPSPKKNP